MAPARQTPQGLNGRWIDAHSHAGVSLKAYALKEYPYAATIEGLYYRQRAGGIDLNVVFPFTADLHYDPGALVRGVIRSAHVPLSPVPYAVENALLLREIETYCPEIAHRFLPFVSVDPGRRVAGQIRELEIVCRDHAVYGIKINPVLCQSALSRLMRPAGARLLDFAEAHDLPLLLHVTPLRDDRYSWAGDAFRIAEQRPGLRFCFAHALLFHRAALQRAADLPNVWVDTAALTIEVAAVRAEVEAGRIDAAALISTDLADPHRVLRDLCRQLPERIIWGTDAPAYAYICRRRQGPGMLREFRLKATYEDEVAALRSLPPRDQRRIASRNPLRFLFGRRG